MARQFTGEQYTGDDGIIHYPWYDDETGESGEELMQPETPPTPPEQPVQQWQPPTNPLMAPAGPTSEQIAAQVPTGAQMYYAPPYTPGTPPEAQPQTAPPMVTPPAGAPPPQPQTLPGAPPPAAGGAEWVNTAVEQLKLANSQAIAALEYQKEKDRLLSIPMLDIERDRLALQKAMQAATIAYQTKGQELEQLRITQNAQQFSQTLSEQQRQYNASLAEQQKQFSIAQTGYTETGAPTLAREQFAAGQQQLAYQRAAAPNRAFENELARGATGQNGPFPVSGLVQQQGAAGMATQPGAYNLANAPVRVPAFVNAFATGAQVPSAGQLSAPSTTVPASQAALGQTQFQQANLKTLSNYSPYQQQVLGSYGQAGGISPEMQQYWLSRGMPSRGASQGSFSLAG